MNRNQNQNQTSNHDFAKARNPFLKSNDLLLRFLSRFDPYEQINSITDQSAEVRGPWSIPRKHVLYWNIVLLLGLWGDLPTFWKLVNILCHTGSDAILFDLCNNSCFPGNRAVVEVPWRKQWRYDIKIHCKANYILKQTNEQKKLESVSTEEHWGSHTSSKASVRNDSTTPSDLQHQVLREWTC